MSDCNGAKVQRWIKVLALSTGAQIPQLKTWVLGWKQDKTQVREGSFPSNHSSSVTQLSQHAVYDTGVWVQSLKHRWNQQNKTAIHLSSVIMLIHFRQNSSL